VGDREGHLRDVLKVGGELPGDAGGQDVEGQRNWWG
jgi:hypothetical protein